MARMESGGTPSIFLAWEWDMESDDEEEEEEEARGWWQVLGDKRGEEEEERWLCEVETALKKSLTWREIMAR